ncbi:GntR family transcriptional repressor for pyruvate dehydrogenase complex [Bacillus ectoiniformans]|uniref:FadR/GntR family transcriptional regulator n=1 Tax=Bacillus ectoiniformans TaxID=1494429 RepID=UPI00195F045E|nr:FadR/GntR family transcriptional regulator [Bacillus ectoiniformans]MBM7647673.1 GntR family transcriptional repressor for pyruvate dehydrogenase complex [Bacillus ectoiniformans]
MYKPTSRTMLYEEVINQILDLIKKGLWKPGEKIPTEMELAQSFEVSRNSMREALKVLEHLKIIQSKAGKGTYLLENSIQNIQALELASVMREANSLDQLMDTRLIIEPELTYRAAAQASLDELNNLEKLLKDSIEAVATNTYFPSLGFSFHMEIAKISRNTLLYKFLESITLELMAQRKLLVLSHLSKKDLLKEIEEHRFIFEAIKQNNPEEAKKRMYVHIQNAKKFLPVKE